MENQSNARAMVYAEVLKQETLFKANLIATATGLQRQLIYYHLQQLVGAGLVEKQGTQYMVVDRNKLIDFMLDASNDSRARRGEPNVLNNPRFESIQNIVDYTVLARALGLTESMEIKTRVAELLKDAASALMAERKYLLEKVMSPNTARKQVRNEGGNEDVWYKEHIGEMAEAINYEFYTKLDERISNFSDRMDETA